MMFNEWLLIRDTPHYTKADFRRDSEGMLLEIFTLLKFHFLLEI
jgi:hypothetical protein